MDEPPSLRIFLSRDPSPSDELPAESIEQLGTCCRCLAHSRTSLSGNPRDTLYRPHSCSPAPSDPKINQLSSVCFHE